MDIVVIDDLVTGDFTDALKGVHALIYVACPFPGRQDIPTTVRVSICSRHTFPYLTTLAYPPFHTGLLIQVIVEGSLNVIRQAYAAGVRHVSHTSTVVTFVEPGAPVYKRLIRSTDWNPLTVEDAEVLQNGMVTYSVSKALAEKALLKFAEEHKDLNLVISKCFALRSRVGS